jgi:hypothetical protein
MPNTYFRIETYFQGTLIETRYFKYDAAEGTFTEMPTGFVPEEGAVVI